MNVVLLDRDGTINRGIPKYERVDSIKKLDLFPDTIEALRYLAKHDFAAVLITNQAGIAENIITEAEFWTINNRLLEMLAPSGIAVLKTYMSPYGFEEQNDWSKPGPGMLLQAAKDFNLKLSETYMVGDRRTDVMAGVNAGSKTILVQSGISNVEAPEADYIAPNLLDAAMYIVRQSAD